MAEPDHANHTSDLKRAAGAGDEEKRPDAMEVDETKRAAPGGPHEIDLEEKRRLDHLESMDKIEKEFSEVKEKLFQEKMTSLEEEMKKVEAGTHDRLLQRMKELQVAKEEKLQAAEQWRQYMLQQTAASFESEKKQADDEYDNDKLNVKEELLVFLQDRQKKLEEEKNTLVLTDANDGGDSRVPNPRALRRRGGGKETLQAERIKKKPSLPPHINYSLKENEIQEDLAAIAKTFLPAGRDARGKANEIFADKGIFHYHDREFEKGSTITIQAARDPAAPKEKENETWTGVVTLVSPAEVQLKTNDGARQRFALTQLRSGKYFIV